MAKYVLGIDVGVTSVGYGVIDLHTNQFVDYGVRLFKEGTAQNNVERRTKRGGRRLIRRRVNRLEDMKKLLEEMGIYDEQYRLINNPYLIRKKGLTEKLNNVELTSAILHITKKRGTTLEVNADEGDDEKSTKGILATNDEALKDKYICEVQLERLEQNGHIKGIENNFKTEDYIKELKQILCNQALTEAQEEQIISIVSRRRRYDQGPGSEKSPTEYGSYRMVNGELVKVNLIDMMRGKCSVYPDEFRAPKQSYTAEMFNFLNDLNNLTIHSHEKISYDQKKEIVEHVNKNGGIKLKKLFELLKVNEEDVSGFRIDTKEKKLITEFKGYKKVRKIFKEFNCLEMIEDKAVVDEIMDINTKAKGVDERKTLIMERYPSFPDELVLKLAEMKDVSGYHSLSFKAMRELNEEMLKTEMNQMQLLHILGMFDQNRKSTKGQSQIYADDDAILSPVAKRAHRETFKVINQLREIYGEFDSIVIETTRDKNTQEQKNRIKKSQKIFEEKNKEVDSFLKEAGYEPTVINSKTKQKIRLYLEQDCKTAYTFEPIDLRLLIKDPTAYEIDHIIPISISLDDSQSNKVLISRIENQQKGQQTPIQAILNGSLKGITISEYRVNIRANKKMIRKKKDYLLFEDDITKYEVVKNFINRNLVDTSYACRTIMTTLKKYFKDNAIPTKVHTIRGQATSAFRRNIGLIKDREEDYFHHAIDALIVASLKKLNLINSYLMKMEFDKMYDENTGEIFPVLPNQQYLDPKYISFVKDIKNIYEESNKYMHGLMTKEEMHYPLIKVSHKIDTKPNRQIANETIYSTRIVDGEEMLVERIKNIYDSKDKQAIKMINNIINGEYDSYIMYHKDPRTFSKIVNIIMNHFETFKSSSEHYKKDKKGKYELVCENPLAEYLEENGYITKYSNKNNGSAVISMKVYSEKLGNHLDISGNYNVENKKVILKQISPYRTDFYRTQEGKIKFVTIRYKDVFYKESRGCFCIDPDFYQKLLDDKNIGDGSEFICSLHRDELIGIKKSEGNKYIYDGSTEGDGLIMYHDGKTYEILKFTATNNDKNNIIEVKPSYTYCRKQLRLSIGPVVDIKKYSTDVLGNLYEVKENVLKLEFK